MLKKRSFSLAGHRTSVALEDDFWEVLLTLAEARGTTLAALIAEIDAARLPEQSLASSLRLAALRAAFEHDRFRLASTAINMLAKTKT